MTRRPPAPDRYASQPGAWAVVTLGTLAATVIGLGIEQDWPTSLLIVITFLCTPVACLGVLAAAAALTIRAQVRGSHRLARQAAGVDHPLSPEDEVLNAQVFTCRAFTPTPETPLMAQRIRHDEVDQALADAGHRTSEYHRDSGDGTPGWDPGYRTAQHGPRAVLLFHDGPGHADGLTTYTTTLRTAGYHVTTDRPQGQRQRLLVTRP